MLLIVCNKSSKFARFQLDFKNFEDVGYYADAWQEYEDIWKESKFSDKYEKAKKAVAEKQKFACDVCLALVVELF